MPNGSSVSDNDAQAEMTSEVLDEPDVNVKSNKKKNNWWLLYHYDHLAYGEIHWRVQNDILYNQQNSITGLKLHIDYTDVPDEDFQSNRSGTYGRADVYKDTPNGITYIPYDGDSSKAWEIDMSGSCYATARKCLAAENDCADISTWTKILKGIKIYYGDNYGTTQTNNVYKVDDLGRYYMFA